MTEALHEKYVPSLHYAREERFYPMAVDDFLRYSVLRQRGVERPIVRERRITPALLRRAYKDRLDVFVQSVPSSLADQNVAALWSRDVLESVVDLSYRASRWQQELARVAYEWFSAKTESATQLFWWNNLVMSLLGQGNLGSHIQVLGIKPPDIRQAALDNYERSQSQSP